MSRTSTAATTPTTELAPIMSIPVMRKVVEPFDWEAANNIQQENDDRTQLVPSASPVLEPSLDYAPSLKLAEEINQINQINHIKQMKEGTLSPTILPTVTSSGISAKSISVGISTLLAQTAASASLSTLSTTAVTATTATTSTITQNAPTTSLRKSSLPVSTTPVPETLACSVPPTSLPSPPSTNQEPVFASIRNNPCPTSTTQLFRFKSTSFKQHEEETVVKVESTDLPMTPPSSQELLEPHDDPLESSFEYESALESNGHNNSSTSSQRQQHRAHNHQHHHQQSFHPFDRTASNAPKKTLNWVNAVPSHFSTSPTGQPRKRRRRTNREELEILEDAFAKNLLPDAATRQELGERLGMSVRAVQIWFQNRRQTLRKKSISGSGVGGVHQGGSEDDLSRSDGERSNCGGSESQRRSSGDSNMSASPVLLPSRGHGHVSRIGSRSCSDLMSASPLTGSLMRSPSLTRADACSALPASVSPLTLPLASPPLRPVAPFKSPPPQAHCESTKDSALGSDHLVAVKAEEAEETLRKRLIVTKSTQDLTDIKSADRHLNMLLQEAKRRSGQGNNPVMATWSEKSSKPVLNSSPSLSGNPLSGTTFFPATTSATISAHRSLSTPTITSSSSRTDYTRQPLSIPSQTHSRSAAPKSARKHRSMPESLSNSTSNRYNQPYPRTMSLMEQVINRQKQQHQPQSHQNHHPRPAPSNFKQSTLSKTGKHTIDSVANRASKSFLASVLPSTTKSTLSSTGISTAELARRLQVVMGNGLKRIQSQSNLTSPVSPTAVTPIPVTPAPTTPIVTVTRPTTGQPAMRARRLSIGQNLFDSDTEDEKRSNISTPPLKHVQQQQQQQIEFHPFPSRKTLTHQAQKRTARTQMTPSNGDETDEEDFREQAKKRASMTKSLAKPFDLGIEQKSFQQLQRQRQHSQDSWSGVHKMPRKVLRTSMSLITSSPTREYGVELEQASRGSPTNFPIRERNHSWGGVHPTDKLSSPLSGTATTAVEADDMNMDEIECANVLAGLGWGR